MHKNLTPPASDLSAPLPAYDGPELTPWQYEALCRHALSREYIIPFHEIRTGYVESPTKTGHGVRHQIDLYWTSSDGICEFLCIANAKFQKTNVTLSHIMTLLGVQRDVQAHKAVMITNTGYSSTALLQAREKGIALLIVRPNPDFNFSVFPGKNAPIIGAEMERLSRGVGDLYNFDVVHRAFDLRRHQTRPAAPPMPPSPCLPVSPLLVFHAAPRSPTK